MKRAVLAAIVVASASACSGEPRTRPPVGQLLVHVDTDAPLPAPAGESLGPDDPPALFDRVRIEVFRPGERTPCAECTHEFDVDRRIVGEGRASVGITTPPGVSGHRARVRLFRAAFVESGEPRADAALDTTVELPPTTDEGVTPVTVMLRTDDVARPIGSLDAPAPATLSTPAGKTAWTWPGARRVPCSGTAAPGEACIPGGAYWMGNPLLRAFQAGGDAVVLRLVSLSPFFLDTTEVRVDRFRDSGVASTDDPMRYSPDDGLPGPIVHCTYTDQPGNDEDLPVNCVSWSKARAYCATRGADLPTEAQLQYAASALEGHLYPWGDDPPTCSDAVFARAAHVIDLEHRCPGSWVAPPGSGGRDRLLRPEGTIVDLVGNLAEHTLDLWNLQTESCWGKGVLHDPLCTEPSSDPNANGQHTVVGGSFVDLAGWAAAAQRRPAFPFARAKAEGPAGGVYARLVAGVGFRCARSAAP